MKARVVIVVVVGAAIVAALGWGFRAGQRAFTQFKEETHKKVVQAEREAMSRAESATAEAEREGRGEETGEASDKEVADSFFVKSITVDGLEKAGMTAGDLGDIEIEMEKSAEGALGRPTAGRVRMGSLMRPVSPLTLYAPEVQRMTAAVVQAVKDRGYVGIYVDPGKPGSERAHPADGNWHWQLLLAVVDRVEVEDRRVVKEPGAELELIRAECPVKVGDHVLGVKLDEFATVLEERYREEVSVVIASSEIAHVTVKFVLGQAER